MGREKWWRVRMEERKKKKKRKKERRKKKKRKRLRTFHPSGIVGGSFKPA